ncbi:hypothetical protein [Saccharothrix texasensis]|uniref:DDE superfamily endonuclease n=1 Tax=Saccharothrix texasensis TaxID=103734 RepID=A0A3N1GXQ4_9PSEU|nr:hypothetical protein EDD40_0269 [Saccharothrix texasensis]
MEDVLAVYARPYHPARPVVCMDEVNVAVTNNGAPVPAMDGHLDPYPAATTGNEHPRV